MKLDGLFYVNVNQARREEQIKAAHDEAIFGVPVLVPSSVSDAKAKSQVPSTSPDTNNESPNKKETNDNIPVTSLLSEKVTVPSPFPFFISFPRMGRAVRACTNI